MYGAYRNEQHTKCNLSRLKTPVEIISKATIGFKWQFLKKDVQEMIFTSCPRRHVACHDTNKLIKLHGMNSSHSIFEIDTGQASATQALNFTAEFLLPSRVLTRLYQYVPAFCKPTRRHFYTLPSKVAIIFGSSFNNNSSVSAIASRINVYVIFELLLIIFIVVCVFLRGRVAVTVSFPVWSRVPHDAIGKSSFGVGGGT